MRSPPSPIPPAPRRASHCPSWHFLHPSHTTALARHPSAAPRRSWRAAGRRLGPGEKSPGAPGERQAGRRPRQGGAAPARPHCVAGGERAARRVRPPSCPPSPVMCAVSAHGTACPDPPSRGWPHFEQQPQRAHRTSTNLRPRPAAVALPTASGPAAACRGTPHPESCRCTAQGCTLAPGRTGSPGLAKCSTHHIVSTGRRQRGGRPPGGRRRPRVPACRHRPPIMSTLLEKRLPRAPCRGSSPPAPFRHGSPPFSPPGVFFPPARVCSALAPGPQRPRAACRAAWLSPQTPNAPIPVYAPRKPERPRRARRLADAPPLPRPTLPPSYPANPPARECSHSALDPVASRLPPSRAPATAPRAARQFSFAGARKSRPGGAHARGAAARGPSRRAGFLPNRGCAEPSTHSSTWNHKTCELPLAPPSLPRLAAPARARALPRPRRAHRWRLRGSCRLATPGGSVPLLDPPPFLDARMRRAPAPETAPTSAASNRLCHDYWPCPSACHCSICHTQLAGRGPPAHPPCCHAHAATPGASICLGRRPAPLGAAGGPQPRLCASFRRLLAGARRIGPPSLADAGRQAAASQGHQDRTLYVLAAPTRRSSRPRRLRIPTPGGTGADRALPRPPVRPRHTPHCCWENLRAAAPARQRRPATGRPRPACVPGRLWLSYCRGAA